MSSSHLFFDLACGRTDIGRIHALIGVIVETATTNYNDTEQHTDHMLAKMLNNLHRKGSSLDSRCNSTTLLAWPHGSLPFSQQPANGHYPERGITSPHSHTLYCNTLIVNCNNVVPMHSSYPEDLTALDWNTLVTAEVPYYASIMLLNPRCYLKEKDRDPTKG